MAYGNVFLVWKESPISSVSRHCITAMVTRDPFSFERQGNASNGRSCRSMSTHSRPIAIDAEETLRISFFCSHGARNEQGRRLCPGLKSTSQVQPSSAWLTVQGRGTHHSLVFTRTIICVPAINVCDIKYFITIFAAGITERAPLAAPSIGEIHENGLRSTVAGGCWWIGLGYCHYCDRHQSQ